MRHPPSQVLKCCVGPAGGPRAGPTSCADVGWRRGWLAWLRIIRIHVKSRTEIPFRLARACPAVKLTFAALAAKGGRALAIPGSSFLRIKVRLLDETELRAIRSTRLGGAGSAGSPGAGAPASGAQGATGRPTLRGGAGCPARLAGRGDSPVRPRHPSANTRAPGPRGPCRPSLTRSVYLSAYSRMVPGRMRSASKLGPAVEK